MSGDLLDNDNPGPANESNQTIIVTDVHSASVGTVSISGSLIAYTPPTDFVGLATFKYDVRDNGQSHGGVNDFKTATGTATVDITAVNDVPTIDEIVEFTIDEDASAQTVNLAGITAGGGESQPLAVNVSTTTPNLLENVTRAYASAQATGSVSFTLGADQNGEGVITVKVTDGGLDGDLDTTEDNATFSRNFTITVDEINDAPILTDDVKATDEDVELTFQANTLLDNDAAGPANESSQNLTVTQVNNPSVGSTVELLDGEVTFTPPANFFGAATFDYIATDDGTSNGALDARVATGKVTVNITEMNDLPTLDFIDNLIVDEDDPAQTVNLAGITAGVGESQPLAIDMTTDAPGLLGSLTKSYTTVEATGSIGFTPIADQNGEAVITVTVTDGGLDGDLDTAEDNATFAREFTVTVNSVNDDPTIDAISDPDSIPEDAGTQTNNLTGITAGGGESQPLLVTATSGNEALIVPSVSYNSPAATGSVSYAPLANAFGQAVVTVTVTDGGADDNLATGEDNLTSVRTFTVSVDSVNDLPTISDVPDQSIPEEGTMGPITFTVDDVETPANELVVTVATSNEELVPLSNITLGGTGAARTVTAYPVIDAVGSTVITLRVKDGDLETSTEPFILSVTDVNDLPTSRDSRIWTREDLPVTIHHWNFSFQDLETPSLHSVRIDTIPDKGELYVGNVLATDGQIVTAAQLEADLLVFHPAPDEHGMPYTSLTFSVFDGTQFAASANTMLFRVLPSGDTPTTEDGQVTTDEDTVFVFDTADFPFADVDNDTLHEIRIKAGPKNGALALNGINLTAGSAIPVEDLAAGWLTFTPEFDASGDHYGDFSFSVIDGTGAVSLPAVMRVDVTDVAPEVVFRLEARNAMGVVIEAAEPGQLVTLNAYVEDNRPDATGVFAAYLDLDFDSQMAYFSGQLQHGATYANGISGQVSVPGSLDEVGGFGAASSPIGGGLKLVFSQQITPFQEGELIVRGSPADIHPIHDILRYNELDAVPARLIDYEPITLRIEDGILPEFPWQNPINQFDVDNDGFVSSFDALTIINRLNNGLGGPLPTPSPGDAPPPYFDVVPDNIVDNADVDAVTAYINGDPTSGGVAGEGDPTMMERYHYVKCHDEPVPRISAGMPIQDQIGFARPETAKLYPNGFAAKSVKRDLLPRTRLERGEERRPVCPVCPSAKQWALSCSDIATIVLA
ncbi:MAG TPA: Ig-like domain-containing protein [Pirellulaceae bacterium]|nr:Ig-like domain-containing protein [Pirellulaceae bacterium]